MNRSKQSMVSPLFYAPEALRELSLKILQISKDLGATDAAVEVSESSGLSVSVRKQAIETLERTRDRAASVTVYSGLKRGHATTSDFSDQSLRDQLGDAARKRVLSNFGTDRVVQQYIDYYESVLSGKNI
jgi:PmbA protein